MMQVKAKVIKNSKIGPVYYRMVIEAPGIAAIAIPGQFVEVKVEGSGEPFLRRPFGVHRVHAKTVELLYEIKGRGTELLSLYKPGQSIDIIGPLGNGFYYQRPTTNYERPILVAGGMGVVPLMYLAEKLALSSELGARSKVRVLIGARSRDHIVCEKEFKKLGCVVKIATDDGSKGFKGKVTDILKRLLTTNYGLRTLYACGPRPMLKAIAGISKEYNIPTQISMEEHMSCGTGVCMGCVVDTVEGYKRVCKDGPVFEASHILWE